MRRNPPSGIAALSILSLLGGIAVIVAQVFVARNLDTISAALFSR